MAGGRPYKEGLNGFYLDCDWSTDDKIRSLRRIHPDKGLEIYLVALTSAYREYGYFLPWDKAALENISDDCRTTEDNVQSIIRTFLEIRLFNNDIYRQHGVLTSASMQDRFLLASKRRGRILIIKDFALFNLHLVHHKELKDKIFFRLYGDNNPLFINGSLNPGWREIPTLELVSPGVAVTEIPRPRARETINGGVAMPEVVVLPMPGSKLVLPGFDWEKEKQIMLDDIEWKTTCCRNFRIGRQLPQGKFEPDMTVLNKWLEDFFMWVEVQKKCRSHHEMVPYFASWYQKKQEYQVLGGGGGKTNIHNIGKRDYENMEKWG